MTVVNTCRLVVVAVSLLFAGLGPVEARTQSRETIQNMVIEEAGKFPQIPAALALAVARVESNFDPLSQSHAGARGVMQIMPRTARTTLMVHPDRLWDARTNIRNGLIFLADLYRAYGNRWDLALSHYNGGSLKKVSGRWVPHSYTRDYVRKVAYWKARYEQEFASRPVAPRVLPEVNTPRPRLSVRHHIDPVSQVTPRESSENAPIIHPMRRSFLKFMNETGFM